MNDKLNFVGFSQKQLTVQKFVHGIKVILS